MRYTLASSSVEVLALSFASLTACGVSRPGEPIGSTGQPISTVCGAPAGGAVQGVDVSHYQGAFNWASGRSFGYAAIGDGTGYADPMFGTNWANMQGAGVLRGAYQFFEPSEDPTAQANLMVAAVGRLGPGDLPCMIDVEVTGGQSGGTIAARIRTWLDVVQAGTGLAPIIYTGPYFWDDNVGDASFGNFPLWIADYGPSCPALPNGWSTWTIWQYGDSGGSLDQDVFNGSMSELQALSGGGGGCNATETADAAHFGCQCVGGMPSGGFCPGTGCSAIETSDAAYFGCSCVDHQASGGFCSGSGCTALETEDAAKFGCQCVDHQGAGGFCPGSGCTALENENASKFGCQCVDHQGAGGYCAGSGCTALETENAAKFGCGCVDHEGAGGFCPGAGCTAREEMDCKAKGKTCAMHACG
jgi:lysozyme